MHYPQVIGNGVFFNPPFHTKGSGVSLLKQHSASGSCMPINPITFGDSDGDTALKNFGHFGKVLSA